MLEQTIRWVQGAHDVPSTRRIIRATVWVLVAVLAAVHLPMPLTGDQGLYMYGAKSLAEGQALYLDFWDAKQPGVYLFYLLAGTLFSFDEIGLHALEGLWFGLAAWFAYRIGRQARPENALTLLIPLLTAGTYFTAVGSWHMTQPDGLLATPLAGVVWALLDKEILTTARARLLAAGFFAGAAAVFKVSVIVVPVALVLAWYLARPKTTERSRVAAVDSAGWFVLGVTVPVGAVVIWFATHGALRELIWTTFHYPLIALEEIAHHPQNLYWSARWFVDMTIFWWPFAAIGGFWSLYRVFKRDAEALPGLLMIVWAFVGAATILLQYHYFWPFHFNQFFVPLGVLAGIGLRVMFDWVGRPLIAQIAAVVIVAGLLALGFFGNKMGIKILPFVDALVETGGVRTAYVDRYDPKTNQIHASLRAALADVQANESIFVFGDPRLLLGSGRWQAVPHNGWALEIMVAEQWREFSQQLRQASPAHIYISDYYVRLLSERYVELMNWIERDYDPYHVDTMAGTWYRLRNTPAGGAEMQDSGDPESAQ
jgi:hypothetical protein